MPASRIAARNVRHNASRLIGPLRFRLGHSHRGLRCTFQRRRSSSRTGCGSGTRRSLLPLPTTRTTPLTPSTAVTSRVAASLVRRPHAYMSRKAVLATGFLTRPRIARASASDGTLGKRLGGRTLFLRTATTRDPACGQRKNGCRRDAAYKCRAPHRADREGAADSCAPLPRSAYRASACRMQQDCGRLGGKPPWLTAPTRQTSCPQSFSDATQSSRYSSVRANRNLCPAVEGNTLDHCSLPARQVATAKPFSPIRFLEQCLLEDV